MKTKGLFLRSAITLLIVVVVSLPGLNTAYGYEIVNVEIGAWRSNVFHEDDETYLYVYGSVTHDITQDLVKSLKFEVIVFKVRRNNAGLEICDDNESFNPPGPGVVLFDLSCDENHHVEVNGISTGQNPVELIAMSRLENPKDGRGPFGSVSSDTIKITQLECTKKIQPLIPDPNNDPPMPEKSHNFKLPIQDPLNNFVPDSVENVSVVDFGLLYDNSIVTIDTAYFLNSALAQYGTVTVTDSVMSFNATLPIPVTVVDSVARIVFTINEDAPIGETASFDYTDWSSYRDSLGVPCSLSFYHNYAVTVSPPDTIFAPVMDSSLISHSQFNVTGLPGSVTDDWDSIPNYIVMELYDEYDSLVTFTYVDSVGCFDLFHFWLTSGTTNKIIARDALGNYDSLLFIPPVSYFPVVYADPDTIGIPGDSIQVGFILFNRCDSTETYNVNAHSDNGWMDPETFQMTLESFADTMLWFDVHIPSDSGAVFNDVVRCRAVSTTDTTSSDEDSLTVSVGIIDLTISIAGNGVVLGWSGYPFVQSFNVYGSSVGPEGPWTLLDTTTAATYTHDHAITNYQKMFYYITTYNP